MKHRISAALLLLALTAQLAACGGSAPRQSDTSAADTPAETTAAPTVYDILPDKDFGGRAFNVLTSEGWSVDMLDQIDVESQTGDVVLDSVWARNQAVEDAFNVVIKPRTVVYKELAGAIRREVQAGETGTDLIAHAPTMLAPLAAEKLFLDVKSLPHTDMTQPWYVPSVNDELEIAGSQYLFLTDLGFVFPSAVNVMLYNLTMADSLGIEDLQDLSLSGKWTLDKFEKCMTDTASDIDGDNAMTNKDRYGIALLWNEMVDTLPYSLGQKITEKDKAGRPQLVLGSERMDTIVRRLNTIFNESDSTYLSSTAAGDTWKTQQEMFRDGQTLFCIMNISSITKRLREMKDDYATIPMPKYDEAQDKYYTGVSLGSSTVFAVPTTTPDREFTSVILEALSAEGADRVVTAYIDTAIKVKFANDARAHEIYDLILDGSIIDFGAIYDSDGTYLLFRKLMQAKSTDFMSQFDAVKTATAAKFEEIWKQYME